MSLRRYLLIVLCGVFIASGAVSGEEVMKAVGGEVSFKLDKIVPPVTSITWKHMKAGALTVKAIEWEDGETIIPNQRFKDITTLDKETGQITITKLTVEHSGVYTIDVSGKEQPDRFTLTVIEPVPEPVIKIEPTGNPGVAYLRCEYDDKIIWKNSAGETLKGSAISPKGESITVKKNGNPEDFYTCTLENAASSKTSERVYERDLFKAESTGGPWWIAIIVIIIILIIGTICAVLYNRNETFKKFVDGQIDKCPCTKGQYSPAKNGTDKDTAKPDSPAQTADNTQVEGIPLSE